MPKKTQIIIANKQASERDQQQQQRTHTAKA